MLKGRSKAFAPKKAPVRRPGGPGGPARPSIERTSQTPAPATVPTKPIDAEAILEVEQTPVPQDPAAKASAPTIETRPPPGTNAQAPEVSIAQAVHNTAGKIAPTDGASKRKSQSDDGGGSAPKRSALESLGRPVAIPRTQEPPGSANVSIPSSAATQDINDTSSQIPTPSEPASIAKAVAEHIERPTLEEREPTKRKAVNDNIAPPAKRVSVQVERPSTFTVGEIATTTSAIQDTPTTSLPHAPPNVTATPPQGSTDISRQGASDNVEDVTQDRAADEVLPSIETGEGSSRPPSALPSTTASEGPRYRYPSPDNMVGVAGPSTLGTPANMGPPGGALGAAGDLAAIARPGEMVQMAALNPDGTSGQVVEEPASGAEASGADKSKKKKKVVRRRKVLQAGEEDADGRATIDMGLSKAKRAAAKRAQKKKKDRKEREDTPSEAEDEIIDPAKLTMTDLCKDLRIGKKFHLHDVIKQREAKRKQESQRNKLREEHPELVNILDAEDEDDEARLAREARIATANAAAEANGGERVEGSNAIEKESTTEPGLAATKGPQFHVVNGQIVLNEETLMINRQADANAERANMEEVEENDFTRLVTSNSFLPTPRTKTQAWDEIETEMFYNCLNQFGTDFNTISKMFPHRNRRQIKLKFNAEERRNSAKITRYLTQPKKAMDLAYFEKYSGTKLESVESIKAEHAALAAEQEAQLAVVLEAAAATDRAKKAEIQKTKEKREAARRMLDSVADDTDSDEEEQPRERGRGTARGESSKENSAPAPSAAESDVGTGKGKGKGKGKAKKKPAKKTKKVADWERGGEVAFVEGYIDD